MVQAYVDIDKQKWDKGICLESHLFMTWSKRNSGFSQAYYIWKVCSLFQFCSCPLHLLKSATDMHRAYILSMERLEWEKSDLNFWISSCEDVHTYIILLMLSIYFHCSQCRLYWGGASITTQHSIANLKCFCFGAVSSSLFFTISCCWSSSLEKGIVFVLSLVIPLLCLPKKTLEQGGAELQHTWSNWKPENLLVGLGNRKDCDRVGGSKNLQQ